MHISDFLDRAAVEADLSATNKVEALHALVELAARAHPSIDRDALFETLSARERLQSTGVGEGYAIPHGKTNAVDGIVACVGRSRAGLDFESLDGKPTHLFFVLLVPEASAALHLKALARVSRLIREPRVREALRSVETADALFELIVSEDARL
jgi:PTS system nitrogen regulatory IIA component